MATQKPPEPAVKPYIPVCDHWPPGTLYDARRKAYQDAVKDGLISHLRIYDTPKGGHKARYLSAIPKEWLYDLLLKYKRAHIEQQLRFLDEGGLLKDDGQKDGETGA